LALTNHPPIFEVAQEDCVQILLACPVILAINRFMSPVTAQPGKFASQAEGQSKTAMMVPGNLRKNLAALASHYAPPLHTNV
jgi:hypothetical protein